VSLIKKYGKWFFNKNAKQYDLAELLSGVIFVPLIFIAAGFLLRNYSLLITLIIMFLIINLYLLFDDILRKRIDFKIPKWMTVIPWLLGFIYLIFNVLNFF